jgi:hypothetical protein
MKLHRKIALAVALIGFVAMLSGIANAQTAVVITRNATFTLPLPANWDGALLPRGNYTLNVTKISDSGAYRIDFTGAGQKHAIVAFSSSGQHAGKQTMLVAENNGATFSIRALHLAKANLVLTFPAAKTTEPELARNQELVSVPIQLAQK